MVVEAERLAIFSTAQLLNLAGIFLILSQGNIVMKIRLVLSAIGFVFAKANGATDAETQEAIGDGTEVRLWSTVLNGSQYDLSKWKSEIDGILKHAAAQ